MYVFFFFYPYIFWLKYNLIFRWSIRLLKPTASLKSTASLHSDLLPSNQQQTDRSKSLWYIVSISLGCSSNKIFCSLRYITTLKCPTLAWDAQVWLGFRSRRKCLSSWLTILGMSIVIFQHPLYSQIVMPLENQVQSRNSLQSIFTASSVSFPPVKIRGSGKGLWVLGRNTNSSKPISSSSSSSSPLIASWVEM